MRQADAGIVVVGGANNDQQATTEGEGVDRASLSLAGEEKSPFWSHFIQKRSVYQDRLGTNIGIVEKKGRFLCRRADGVGQPRGQRLAGGEGALCCGPR